MALWLRGCGVAFGLHGHLDDLYAPPLCSGIVSASLGRNYCFECIAPFAPKVGARKGGVVALLKPQPFGADRQIKESLWRGVACV